MLPDPKKGKPEVMLLATGSEVSLCVDPYQQLNNEGIKARGASMPSWDLFHKQGREYRNSVLPPEITAPIAVEKASTLGWKRYVTCEGHIIGMKLVHPANGWMSTSGCGARHCSRLRDFALPQWQGPPASRFAGRVRGTMNIFFARG